MTRIIVVLKEISLMNVDYFRYLVVTDDFLIFRLCKNQRGAQCVLGDNNVAFIGYCGACNNGNLAGYYRWWWWFNFIILMRSIAENIRLKLKKYLPRFRISRHRSYIAANICGQLFCKSTFPHIFYGRTFFDRHIYKVPLKEPELDKHNKKKKKLKKSPINFPRKMT